MIEINRVARHLFVSNYGVETDSETDEQCQWLEYTQCGTSQKSPTGKGGLKYQRNIEPLDNTEFDDS